MPHGPTNLSTSDMLGTPHNELQLAVHDPSRRDLNVFLGDSTCTIGGAPDCSLRLTGPWVRPVHCVVLRGRTKSVVRNWAGDALLNGRRFDDAVLAEGDRLSIGPVDLEVVEIGTATEGQSDDSSSLEPFASFGPSPAALHGEGGDGEIDRRRCRRLLARARQLRDQLKSNEEEWSHVRDTAEDADTRLAERESECESLRDRLKTTEEERQRLEDVVAAAETRAAQAETECGKLRDSVQDRKTRAQGLTTRAEELESESRRMREELERLRTQIQEHRSQANLDRAKVQSMKDETDAQESREQNLKDRARNLAHATKELEHRAEEVARQKTSIAKREERLAAQERAVEARLSAVDSQSNTESLLKRDTAAKDRSGGPDSPVSHQDTSQHDKTTADTQVVEQLPNEAFTSVTPDAPVTAAGVLQQLGVSQDPTDSEEVASARPALPPTVPIIPTEENAGAQHSDGNSEDFAAYMEGLMQRYRGADTSPPNADTIPMGPPPTSAQPKVPLPASPEPPVDQQPSQKPKPEAKRQSPPVQSTNLSAMRELANDSADMAIHRYNRQSLIRRTLSRFALIGLCLALSLFPIWSLAGDSSALIYAGFVGVIFVVYTIWQFQGASSKSRRNRAKPESSSEPAQDTTAKDKADTERDAAPQSSECSVIAASDGDVEEPHDV